MFCETTNHSGTVPLSSPFEKSCPQEQGQLLGCSNLDEAPHSCFRAWLDNQHRTWTQHSEAMFSQGRICRNDAFGGMAFRRSGDQKLFGSHTRIARTLRCFASSHLASGFRPYQLGWLAHRVICLLLGVSRHETVPAGKIQHLALSSNPRSKMCNKTPCNSPPPRTARNGAWFCHETCWSNSPQHRPAVAPRHEDTHLAHCCGACGKQHISIRNCRLPSPGGR